MSQNVFFGPANFNYDNPAEFFPTRFRIKIRFLYKINAKVYVLKNIFFPKVFLWTRRMQFQQTRQKNRQGPKTSAQCLKMIKNFICFPKQFFFKKYFYRHGEYSFDRPANFFPFKYRNWSEKSRQKSKTFSKHFSAICSYGELESSLKARWLLSRQAAEIFPLDFRKKTFCKFSKWFSPESFHWNWESGFDNSAKFCCKFRSKKLPGVQKWKKN